MRFLVLQHVPHETPGLLAECFTGEGIALDTVELWRDPTIPPVDRYQAIVVMGGPMGVNDAADAYPTKAVELKAIETAVRCELPFLGICLGSQLLAAALGARVYPNPAGKEIGLTTLTLTREGQRSPLFKGIEETLDVLEWHGDAFDLPEGAKLLAVGKRCVNQAFSYARAYGLLFHLEMRASMVKNLVEVDRSWINTPQPLDEQAMQQAFRDGEARMHHACRTIAGNFVAIARNAGMSV